MYIYHDKQFPSKSICKERVQKPKNSVICTEETDVNGIKVLWCSGGQGSVDSLDNGLPEALQKAPVAL